LSYYFGMMIAGSGSGSIPLTSGSGSGSWRRKNMWIRWIRNRNTDLKFKLLTPQNIFHPNLLFKWSSLSIRPLSLLPPRTDPSEMPTFRFFLFHLQNTTSCDSQCCKSGMFIPYPNFLHPGCRVKKIPDPGFAIRIKEFSTQKFVSKLWET
jgi:hypothetical protein